MARLPISGSDVGTWGDVLNGFLTVEHNADGTLKLRTDGTLSGFVPTTSIGAASGVAPLDGSSFVPLSNIPSLTSLYISTAGSNNPVVTNNALANGFMRVDLNYSPTGSTPDALAFYHNGVRTGYHNEKGELRSRAAADNSVPFRVQQRSPSQTANLTEWTQSDNTVLASVAADGTLSAPNVDRTLSYGASPPSNPRVGDVWIVP